MWKALIVFLLSSMLIFISGIIISQNFIFTGETVDFIIVFSTINFSTMVTLFYLIKKPSTNK